MPSDDAAGEDKKIYNRRLSENEKGLAALRMFYSGGYSDYFIKQARRMLSRGFTPGELGAASVDDVMRRWLCCVIKGDPIIVICDCKAESTIVMCTGLHDYEQFE